MKKFLFTLVALLMAGSAVADNYMYIEDFEVSQELLANTAPKQRRMSIPVKAHFSEYVSAWQLYWELPENVTVYSLVTGSTYDLTYMNANDQQLTFTPGMSSDMENCTAIAAVLLEQGYYYPEGTDPDYDDPVSYGNPKWLGDYEEYLVITLQFAQEFTGGDLKLITEGASTDDPRGPVCPKGEHIENVCHITVEGGVEPIQTPAPEIQVTAGDDAYIFTAVGEGEVTLFCDGVEVENPYTVARTDVDQIIKLTAVAHVEGQTDGSVYGEYFVPALEVVEPVDPSGEIIISDPDENGVVTITYTGDEEDVTITVTVNGEEVELGEGGTVTVGEGESEIVVVVGGEGYNDLTASKTVNYTVPEPPQPQTATPEITYVVNDDNVVITATGDGEVILCVDGVEVENPYTIERGAADVVVVVTATAQVEGELISEVATMEITIPAIGTEPEDPHATGVWVVFIQPDGQESWHAMTPGEGEPTPYNITLPLGKGVYGYPVDGVEPYVDFYLVVEGTIYGPEVYDELTEIEEYGDAALHQLYEDGEHFAVPSGYWYTIGVITDRHTGIKYMQISKGPWTDVNELNADKTVAGVRYFNMAGQEMQEANGMTIVVTTYTDGTTSATKVMK